MRSCSRWGLPSRPRHRDRWCALTAPFHPCPQRPAYAERPLAVCSLLHFPWAHAPWGLPSTLPYGVRTFLERRPRRPLARKRRRDTRDHLGDSEPRILSSMLLTSRSASAFSSRGTARNSTCGTRAAASCAAAFRGLSPACLTRYSPVICRTTSSESIHTVSRLA